MSLISGPGTTVPLCTVCTACANLDQSLFVGIVAVEEARAFHGSRRGCRGARLDKADHQAQRDQDAGQEKHHR